MKIGWFILPHYCAYAKPEPEFFSGVRVTRSLVLCVCFVDRYLSFCLFSFAIVTLVTNPVISHE